MSSEERILEQVLRKRNDAVEKLYDTYAPKLLTVCFRYCGNREDAEDVLHESFIKILKNIHRFKYSGAGSMVSWMTRIVVNTAINSLRRKSHFTSVSYEIPDQETEDNDEDFFGSMNRKISGDEVMKLIAALPDGYRMVFNMYVFDNYSHRDIARELNFTESNSKSQLSKARAMLRRGIENIIAGNNVSYEKRKEFIG